MTILLTQLGYCSVITCSESGWLALLWHSCDNYGDEIISPYTSLSPQYKRRVCGVWEERTSGVGSKDRMYESAIQLLKLRKWVVVSHYFCSCHNVVACRHRIHWYDRTCLRWVDLVNLVPNYVFNLQFNIIEKDFEDICKTCMIR